ncbi:S8 family serine peptidase [Alkalicoccus chagannorensis]|uniref:S8 family serine peptidase n=1 Tax=Alkalicoccus chagannorensis TaxID=427072 RepID=UPI0004222336|nr:S8 family serine peptidase [Alkalicoccus chagannorensis]
MRKKGTKLSAVTLGLLLVSSAAVTPAAAETTGDGERVTSLSDHTETQERDGLSELQEITGAEADEKVDVIIELEELSGIERATMQQQSYQDLSEEEQQAFEREIVSSQELVKQSVADAGLDIEYIEEFQTVLNGFSAEVTPEEAERLESLLGIKRVSPVQEYERPEVTPDTNFGSEMVEAQQARDAYGFDGEGMVIGVIDSGADPEHQDFVLDEGVETAITEEDVEGHDGPGAFATDKVPYEYNYMDQDEVTRDIMADASHGMHVAGTAAANGDPEEGGIQGVAPNAQILNLKVFGNDPELQTTSSDVYIQAMEDAVELGADVLNLSLGSPAGFSLPESPEQEAVENAKDNGLIVSISAGNSDRMGSGYAEPFAANPETGVVGAPSVSESSISVASSENTHMQVDLLRYEGEETNTLPYGSYSAYDPQDVLDGEYELVYAGLGQESDFEELDEDVEGKIVVTMRGENPFTEKTLNAQDRGAVGSIIVNNEPGSISLASDPEIEIPHLGMSNEAGMELVEEMQNTSVTVDFSEGTQTVENPQMNEMSDFTSWGLTPTLEFKPEITAPGGQILSTLEEGEYGVMSGTSMAAPHVAGGSALMLERVEELFDLSGFEKAQKAETMMMNTAEPKLDSAENNEWETFYSPRRQGAGEMNLYSAGSTPVTVTYSDTNKGTVALKEFEQTTSFELDVRNFSEEEVTYDVDTAVQSMQVNGNRVSDDAGPLEGAEVNVEGGEEELHLEAGEETSVTIHVDTTDAEVYDQEAGAYVSAVEAFENGYFVDGFVTFDAVNDDAPQLSVPFSGFDGPWGDAPHVDPAAHEEEAFYDGIPEGTGLLLFDGFNLLPLGLNPFTEEVDEENLAFSPQSGMLLPEVSLLRNVESLNVHLLDEEGNQKKTILEEENLPKSYFDGGMVPSTLLEEALWTGEIGGNLVEDGDYIIQYETTLPFDDTETQTYDIPFVLDTTPPVVSNVEIENENTILWEEEANGSDVLAAQVMINGIEETFMESGVEEFSLDENLEEGDHVQVAVIDYADNVGAAEQTYVDGDLSLIVDSPQPNTITNVDEKIVEGQVFAEDGLDSLQLNEEELDVEETNEGWYSFGESIAFEEGTKELTFEAVDNEGDQSEVTRSLLVDRTAPEIDLSEAPENVPNGSSSVEVPVTLTDNNDAVDLYVNGSQVIEVTSEDLFADNELNETVEVSLDLETGSNTFEMEAFDAAGNSTEKTYEVTRAEAPSGGSIPVPSPPVEEEQEQDGEHLNQIESQLEEEGETVVLSVEEETGELNLSEEELKKTAEQQRHLTVESADASVTIPSSVVEEMAAAGEGSIRLNMSETEEDNAVSEALEVSVQAGEESMDEFSDAVTITMNVNEEESDPRTIVGYHIDDDGERTFKGGNAEDGTLTFTTDHFSTFVAVDNARTFDDAVDHWSEDYVTVMAAREVIEGMDDDSFQPEGDVTRAEFAALVTRSFELEAEEAPTFDDTDSGAWYADYVAAAAEAGVVEGDGNEFRPDDTITREEMALMLVRAYELDGEMQEGTATFLDQRDINDWSAEAVSKAAQAGWIEGRDNDRFDPQDTATRGEAAAVFYRTMGIE